MTDRASSRRGAARPSRVLRWPAAIEPHLGQHGDHVAPILTQDVVAMVLAWGSYLKRGESKLSGPNWNLPTWMPKVADAIVRQGCEP